MMSNRDYLQELDKELETLITQRDRLKKDVEETNIFTEYVIEVLKLSRKVTQNSLILEWCIYMRN